MELKTFEKELVYNGDKVKLFLGKYMEPQNNALFMETIDGDPHTTCSVNIDTEEPLEEDVVLIKDYSENEGMMDFLLENRVIEEVVGLESSGYVLIPVARLAMDKFVVVEEN